MEDRKNNTVLVVIITVLVMLVLGLVGYIIYDKVIKNDNVNQGKQNTEVNQGGQNIGELEENDELIEVVDYINYTNGEISIKLPKLTTDNSEASKLNKLIQNDFSDYIEISKGTKKFENENVNYKYDDGGNYVVINVYTIGIGPNSGGCNDPGNYYVFDKKNNKYLNPEDVLKLANVSKSELLKNAKKYMDEHKPPFDYIEKLQDELDNNTFIAYIKDNKVIIEILNDGCYMYREEHTIVD